jgi:hypothetical protein
MRLPRPTALLPVLFIAACSGSSQPAGPTPPSTTAPAPTPAPTPTPQPTPTPPAAVAAKCTLDRSDGTSCGKEQRPNGTDRTLFYEDLQRAQRQVKAEKPGLFKGNKIKNEGTYMAAVILQMLDYGYCAELGPSQDEISLKIGTNTFSEVYDIIFGEGRSATTDYKYTCRPAHF